MNLCVLLICKLNLKIHVQVDPSKLIYFGDLLALKGNDILAAAKTGSDKTLAFLVPLDFRNTVLQQMEKTRQSRSPHSDSYKEMATQIYKTINAIGVYHKFSIGLLVGGQNLNAIIGSKRSLRSYLLVNR